MRSGKRCAYLLVDDGNDANELPVIDGAVGFDVGLEHYIIDSERNEVENPYHLKHQLKKLRREQREPSRRR